MKFHAKSLFFLGDVDDYIRLRFSKVRSQMVYYTFLFTDAVGKAIDLNSNDELPFMFLINLSINHYSPPKVTLTILHVILKSITYKNCHIFCGMLRAADEGIATLQKRNLLDNTIILYTTGRQQQVVVFGH